VKGGDNMHINGMGMMMTNGMGMMPPMYSIEKSTPDFEAIVAKKLEQKDADNSGGLNIDEVSISEEAFAAVDADGSGELNSDELVEYETGRYEALHSKRSQGMQGFQMFGMPPVESGYSVSTIIEEKDADGNGTLSGSEIDISEDAFSAIDTDEDGELSSDELADSGSILHDALHAQRLMEDHDENGDGVLTDDELDISTDVFGKIDTNGDGTLSRAEVEEMESRESMPRSRDNMMMPGMAFGSGSQFMGSMSGASMYSMVSDSYFNSFGNANMSRFGLFA
jgi:Ca2+-binding EF-hand superfamily protein